MQPCRMSAVALLDAYRSRALSPLEAMQRCARSASRCFEPHIQATYLLAPERALEGARAPRSAGGGASRRAARRRAGDHQGQHRHRGDPGAARHARATELAPAQPRTRRRRRGVREAGAVILGQDHHARLRHAVLRASPASTADAQPLGPDAQYPAAPAPAPAPRRRPATGRCTSAPTSAARCACRRAGAASSRSSLALGRVPVDPPYMGRVAGPMTRTVRDAALHDGRARAARCARLHEPAAAGASTGATLDAARAPRGLRIGLLLEAGCGLPVRSPRCAPPSKPRRARFGRAGARVEPIAPFLTQDMLDGHATASGACARSSTCAPLPAAAARQGAAVHRASGRERAAELQRRDGLRRPSARCMAMREAAVSATAAVRFRARRRPRRSRAFAAELAVAEQRSAATPLPHIGFTVAFNMSEQPAASINCGYSDEGLPIGLQIVGRRFDDLGVLRRRDGVRGDARARGAGVARAAGERSNRRQRHSRGRNAHDRFDSRPVERIASRRGAMELVRAT